MIHSIRLRFPTLDK
ncbi:erythromycin resistance leader peptide [Pseudalkalibacillus sp. A8]